MGKPLLTVVTVNCNHHRLIALQLDALKRLTAAPYRVVIADNGSNPTDVRGLVEAVRRHDNAAAIFRTPRAVGSAAHGEALDELIDWVDTPYAVVTDGDCTLLTKDWDAKLIQLLDERIKIVGATSPPHRSGVRIGAGTFPLPFAALFDREVYRQTGARCAIGDVTQGQDTCWLWEQSFQACGYEGKVLETRNSRDFPDGPFGAFTGVEEYYTEGGELMAAHFGRGTTRGAAKYYQGFNLPLIAGPLKRMRGAQELGQWIDKCYEIIESQ